MPESILKMTDISKVFGGVIALNKVQFELSKGSVHALIGENGAGKSTLMKVLLGIHKRDNGTILYNGEEVSFSDPSRALQAGISMIHQEVSLVHKMTVAENIWLGREQMFSKVGYLLVNKRKRETKKLLDSLEIDIDPDTIVEELSIAQMQLVELARAVSYHPNIIIMDEPTSALTDQEVEKLYKIIRSLKAEGVAIIFISHKLEELYEICDSVTVMRDGTYIGTYSMQEISKNMLIKMITGREVSTLFEKEKHELGEVAFEVKNLTHYGKCYDVNFQVRAGEVVGLCGLMGAGRTEILRAVFGIDKKDAGSVYVQGKEAVIYSPKEAVAAGIGMVTEDRLRQGVIYTMSVMHNATLAVFNRLCNKIHYSSPRKEEKLFREKANDLSVKYSSPKAKIGELSGGNQQKVIIERWLLTEPKILLLDEPTRGIDVGAKSEIYELIDRMSKEGKAIVMASSEMPELLSLCDRILVVYQGRIVFECPREEATQERLMHYAFGLSGEGS